jgi:maleylacetoacetate isomerase
MTDVVLYDYWRSSASYRLRIAMNLAGISYQSVSVDLLRGEHKTEAYLNRNPQGLVPVLEIDGYSMTQSLAILEYLNDTREITLISTDPVSAAQERAIAHAIAVDINPVCNVSVAAYAVRQSGRDETRVEWMQRFIAPGLTAVETMLNMRPKTAFAHGDAPGLIDICIMPQLYNADRWGVDVSTHTNIMRIAENCAAYPAFQAAHPDAVKPSK